MLKDSKPPDLQMDPVYTWLSIKNKVDPSHDGPIDDLRLCVVGYLRNIGIDVAFSDRNGGVGKGSYEALNVDYRVGDEQSVVTENRNLLKAALNISQEEELITVGQPHGDMIVTTDEARRKDVDADAVFLGVGSAAVMLMFADCVPIVLVDAVLRTAVSVHAGWQSSVAGITKAAVGFMQERGSNPDNIEVFFGPSARGCCYEVGPEVLEKLGLPSGSRSKVDLVSWHIKRLADTGIPLGNMHDSGLCTCCRPEEYFSFRRDGAKTGRQASVVNIR